MLFWANFAFVLSLSLTTTWAAEWSYEGEHGPDHWGAVCNAGKAQSPIDIPASNVQEAKYNPFTFLGYDKEFKGTTLANNGHTVQMGFDLGKGQLAPTVIGGGLEGTYEFAQFHLHWGSKDTQGSEHTVGKKAYPMELHLVHFKKEYGSDITASLGKRQVNDNLAVLGIFFEIQDEDNKALNPLIEALANVNKKDDTTDMKTFALSTLLPRNTDGFYRYPGSLTTPGCNEVVVWTVFKDPIGISKGQMDKFRQLQENETGKKMVDNFRPVQPLFTRQVLDVETSSKKFKSSATTLSLVTLTSVLLSSALAMIL